MDFTKRRNINRGYMKLEVWNDSVALFVLVHKSLAETEKIDFKFKGQILDAAQSISANIAEGYCGRSINEYLYFLNVALGASGETMTRMIGLKNIQKLSSEQFENFDKLHFEVENKLLALVRSLQKKRKDGSWDTEIHEQIAEYRSTKVSVPNIP